MDSVGSWQRLFRVGKGVRLWFFSIVLGAWLSPALVASATPDALEPVRPTVKTVDGGESTTRPEDCRATLVGPGVNQPEEFPGYRGFVGWESPVRLD